MLVVSRSDMDRQRTDQLAALRRRVAELEAAHKALQERQRKLGSIFNNATVGMILIDSAGRFKDCNATWCAMLGYSLDELLQMTVEDVTPEGECVLLPRLCQKEAPFQRVEKRYRRKDGSEFWGDICVAVTLDRDGQVDGMSGIVIDITERKRAEEALRENSERLEEKVEERTRALSQAQERLLRQERLAALGQLAGSLGHELRRPLGVITAAAYFLLQVLDDPDPDIRSALEILEREVAWSETIISNLLDYARVKPPDRRPVDVNQLVQKVLERIPTPATIDVVLALDPGLPEIMADPDQLSQAFSNIIHNAIQAMTPPLAPAGGGQLTLASTVAASAGAIALAFTDTGVGIPEENLSQVFEPLFTTKSKGIGLGLALVKTLVERQGGRIEAASQIGEGTTFTVTLPREVARETRDSDGE